MLQTLRGLTFSAVLAAITLFSGTALACGCYPPPPPCEAIGHSELVFLGTVTEVSTKPGQFKTARMNVDRAFKGALTKTIELFDDGMCDGPGDLLVGKQYLMYTRRFPNGAVPARGCTRSRRVEAAAEDLDFLQQYSAGKMTTHIDGTVRFRPDEPDDNKLGKEGRTPMKGVRVTLSGNGEEYHATTNSVGGYSFSNLTPGQYAIGADLAGYRLNWAPDSVVLVANGCAEANVLMKVDRRVEGTVRDKGEPVSGALVEIGFSDPKQKKWPLPRNISDENGHYSIAGIAPGDYYLGVNINSTSTKEHPFPRTYYPNTPDIHNAVQISVATGVSVQEVDLQVPRRLPTVTVQGRIQRAGGKPPLPKERPQIRITEPGVEGQLETEEIVLDANGRFQFELCEGIVYSAYAFSGSIQAWTYSAPVVFTPTKANDQLVLTLDETGEEFDKLRP